MKNKDNIRDKTKIFLGLQSEILATQKVPSFDIRTRLDQAAKDLATYFENPDIIPIALGAGGLRYEHAFLQENQTKSWVEQNIRLMLTEFRQARSANANVCLQTWGRWMERTDRAISNMAGVASLQSDIEQLSAEITAKSVLRDIGDILEGSLQPLARLRLDMQGVAGMRAPSSSPTESMSFGKVIEELALRLTGGDIYCPEPFRLKVNQWRNIANHNSYAIANDTVICTYGKTGNLQEIRCSVTDIIDLGVYINNLYYTHKIAFEIFSIDNREKLSPYMSEIQITEHTKDGALAYGLVSSGFEIVKIGQKPDVWILGLTDKFKRKEGEIKSALQAAAVTYLLLAESATIIAYVNSDGTIYQYSFKSDIGNNEHKLPPERDDSNLIFLDRYWRPILRKNTIK